MCCTGVQTSSDACTVRLRVHNRSAPSELLPAQDLTSGSAPNTRQRKAASFAACAAICLRCSVCSGAENGADCRRLCSARSCVCSMTSCWNSSICSHSRQGYRATTLLSPRFCIDPSALSEIATKDVQSGHVACIRCQVSASCDFLDCLRRPPMNSAPTARRRAKL